MEWIANLRGKTVGLDTAPLIYFIEEHSGYASIVNPFFESAQRGELQLVTSTITLLEVLVHPLRHKNEALAQQYYDILLSSPYVAILPVTFATAQVAAELRAEHNLKTPDAIQVATALSHRADAFLTGDRDIHDIEGLALLKLHELLA